MLFFLWYVLLSTTGTHILLDVLLCKVFLRVVPYDGEPFYWACFKFNIFSESIIETGNFYKGVAKCSRRKFASSFSLKFLSICVHVSGSIEPMIPIWSKVMTLEVELKPTLVMTGYARVNGLKKEKKRNLNIP